MRVWSNLATPSQELTEQRVLVVAEGEERMEMFWVSRVGFTHEKADLEHLVDALDALADFSAVGSSRRDGFGGSIQLTVKAGSLTKATGKAINLVEDALGYLAGVEIVSVETMTEQAFERSLEAPMLPELVGMSDIAEMAGISRQRVHQLAGSPGFPTPVAATRQGPLMTKIAAERWVQSRTNVREPAYT